jgi:hypothetical protein
VHQPVLIAQHSFVDSETQLSGGIQAEQGSLRLLIAQLRRYWCVLEILWFLRCFDNMSVVLAPVEEFV